MKKNKIEVIRQKDSDAKCYICGGTGKIKEGLCIACKGTGIFVDTSYILIANGIAFGMDTIK